MWRKFTWAVALFGVVAGHALANTVWTGSVSDSWFNAGNWNNGIPDVNFAVTQRAQIESITDLANWSVIKNGESVVMSQRVLLPQNPAAIGQTRYGRLTIQSGGSLETSDDFRAGDSPGFADRPMVGSLVVAGDLILGDTARFGDNAFMTLTVDVTGSIISNADDEDFRIGTGDDTDVDFSISGTGLVSVAGPFEMDAGGLLSLSDDGTLTLYEHIVEDEDDLGNPIFIPTTKADLIDLIEGFAADGLIEGLTNTYSGPQLLRSVGNGVAYYEGADSVSFVAIPEPTAVLLMVLGGLACVSMRRRRL
ncbi:MAG: PEP-CTERM sorting domain-containing protein [Pirellulales bacterium]